MSAVATRPAAQSTDDLGLVAAVRAGDDRAFELLYTRYQRRIAAYVRGMVRDEGRAEDIVQEVFMSALRRMRETDREIDFKPWIYEIAKNACIDAFRRARNTHEVSYDAEDALAPADLGRLAAPGSASDAVVDAKLTLDDLCGAFNGLSQTHHDILVMREFEGLSYREIGERLGMSRAAVESTLFRARRRIGEEYEEIVSGKRCVRVRGIVDMPAGHAVGVRDQRRMARHVSHCQPCRRYALMAGADLAARPASIAAKVGALLPWPAFLRRRGDAEEAGSQLLGTHLTPVVHWSSKVVTVLDPATVSGWSKAAVTAAGVAIAGLGAGAAISERENLKSFLGSAPALAGLAPDRPESDRGTTSAGRATSLQAAAARLKEAHDKAGGVPGITSGAGAGGTGIEDRPGSTGAAEPSRSASPGGPTDGGAARQADGDLPNLALPGIDVSGDETDDGGGADPLGMLDDANNVTPEVGAAVPGDAGGVAPGVVGGGAPGVGPTVAPLVPVAPVVPVVPVDPGGVVGGVTGGTGAGSNVNGAIGAGDAAAAPVNQALGGIGPGS